MTNFRNNAEIREQSGNRAAPRLARKAGNGGRGVYKEPWHPLMTFLSPEPNIAHHNTSLHPTPAHSAPTTSVPMYHPATLPSLHCTMMRRRDTFHYLIEQLAVYPDEVLVQFWTLSGHLLYQVVLMAILCFSFQIGPHPNKSRLPRLRLLILLLVLQDQGLGYCHSFNGVDVVQEGLFATFLGVISDIIMSKSSMVNSREMLLMLQENCECMAFGWFLPFVVAHFSWRHTGCHYGCFRHSGCGKDGLDTVDLCTPSMYALSYELYVRPQLRTSCRRGLGVAFGFEIRSVNRDPVTNFGDAIILQYDYDSIIVSCRH